MKMRTPPLPFYPALVASAAVLTIAACGGGGGGGDTAVTGTGTLRVALTDAPACGYDHVYVTVEKVRVHQSSSAGDADAGWSEVVLAAPKRIDLLTLTNGVLEELGTTQLPAGRYTQVRLVLATNSGGGASAFANSVQPTGSQEKALSTPSAQQSGLKLQANVDVNPGQTADLVLDFDACKSVVRAGNSGQYLLKPVVSVVPRLTSSIAGYVTTTLSLTGTTVSAQQNGAPVRSTTPDANGFFNIPYLPAGTYTLVITSEGRATGVVNSVPTGTGTTTINGTATAVVLPLSSMANVTGTVSLSTVNGTATVVTPVTDALVRATQSLTGGPVVEVQSQPVDSVGGTYQLRLPTGAPVKATYGGTSTLSFTPDTAVARKYTLEAAAPGRVTQSTPLDVSGTTATTRNFTWGP